MLNVPERLACDTSLYTAAEAPDQPALGRAVVLGARVLEEVAAQQ